MLAGIVTTPSEQRPMGALDQTGDAWAKPHLHDLWDTGGYGKAEVESVNGKVLVSCSCDRIPDQANLTLFLSSV